MPRRKAKLKRVRKKPILKSSFFEKVRKLSALDIAFLVIVSLYIGGAVFRLSDPILWERKVSQEKVVEVPPTKLPPTRIKISSLNLDLPVSAGLVKDNTWDMFDDKIAWLATSAVPGEGNVILYGHNRRGLFGNLYKVKIGGVIEVKKGEDWVSYKVTEVRRVLPTDVQSILSDKSRLTLYTCDGSFDQKRLVVYADPVVN